MKYCLDSCSLIDAWFHWYPINNIPPFWKNLEELGKSKLLTIPEMVFKELEKQDDALFHWIKERKKFLITKTDIKEIKDNLNFLTGTYKNFGNSVLKNQADPFVVATSMYFEKCTIITHEGSSGNMNGPKIPDICIAEKIKVIKINKLLVLENWIFSENSK